MVLWEFVILAMYWSLTTWPLYPPLSTCWHALTCVYIRVCTPKCPHVEVRTFNVLCLSSLRVFHTILWDTVTQRTWSLPLRVDCLGRKCLGSACPLLLPSVLALQTPINTAVFSNVCWSFSVGPHASQKAHYSVSDLLSSLPSLKSWCL